MTAASIKNPGAFEATDDSTSATDVAAARIALATGGAYALVGAKGPGSVGAKLQTVLAGVIKDALVAAANGNLTTFNALAVSQLLDLSGASAGQIQFPASQHSSSDVNTLDDYEEGTWTPIIGSDGGTATGQTYTTQVGQYTKVGNLVVVWFRALVSVKGTIPAGNAQIKGLPFSVKSGAAYYATQALDFQVMNTNWSVIFAILTSSTATFLGGSQPASPSTSRALPQASDLTNGTTFAGCITYVTD